MPHLEFLPTAYDQQADGLCLQVHSRPAVAGRPVVDLQLTCPSAQRAFWVVIEDCRLGPGPSGNLLTWLSACWLPALHTAGLVHWGWVCSNPLSRNLAEQLAIYLPKLALHIFHDTEQATRCLRQYVRAEGAPVEQLPHPQYEAEVGERPAAAQQLPFEQLLRGCYLGGRAHLSVA